MKLFRSCVIVFALFLDGVVVGCGGGGGTTPVCAAGASVSCTCTNGQTGAQICSSNGSDFGECVCSASGGSVGSGGALGTGGEPGTGGLLGAAGVIGTGGVIGLAGANGSAGAASGGHAGSGAAGTVGATGAAGQAGGGTSGASGYTGRWVSVQFVDAIIAPAESNGSPWDGVGTVPQSVIDEVSTALVGANPVAGVLAALADPALSTFDPPDPYGTVQATVFGIPGPVYPDLASSTNPVPNTYNPIWPNGGFTYTNVPIDSDVRILVSLWDSDLVYDDTIGAATINSSDLMTALAADHKYEVQVNDQTNNQLLFIGIEVVQQAGEL